MLRRYSLVFLLCAGCCLGPSLPAGAPQKLEAGKILEHVECNKSPEQSYALYLPSAYGRDRKWPVVLVSDPGARGKIPVELMKDAAERHGYIVMGSNNSRNGPWKPEASAADAMLQDAEERFGIDMKRIYFAGFSGGARVASQLAQLCKCSAGVLLSGAGFSINSSPQREHSFPVFSAVGKLDFNYSELVPLQDKLEEAGYPHWLRVFEGQHQWAPAEVMDEAFAWFRIQAMRSDREPRDANFIAGTLKNYTAAAESENASGNSLSAWRLYRQISETFAGIANVAEFSAKAEALSRTKSVQSALKREKNDFEEQARIGGQILNALQAKENFEAPRSAEQMTVMEDIRALRSRAETEKKPDRAVVLKRALAGIFVGTIESGTAALERKDYRAAVAEFSAATEARPDADWPLRQLAIALALAKDRKRTVETLKRAKAKAADGQEFTRWLQAEPAFGELRQRSELPELGTNP